MNMNKKFKEAICSFYNELNDFMSNYDYPEKHCYHGNYKMILRRKDEIINVEIKDIYISDYFSMITFKVPNYFNDLEDFVKTVEFELNCRIERLESFLEEI